MCTCIENVASCRRNPAMPDAEMIANTPSDKTIVLGETLAIVAHDQIASTIGTNMRFRGIGIIG